MDTQPTTPPPATPKRLVRSKTNKVIAGVCAGLGDYLGFDPTIIRVLFVVLLFGDGFGLLLYLILWFLMPEGETDARSVEERAKGAAEQMKSTAQGAINTVQRVNQTDGRVVIGAILIMFGAMALINIYLPWKFFRWETIWPILIVAAGLAIILKRK